MNDTIRQLLSHRTIRAFLDRPVEEEKVQLILDAGRHASTSMGMQAFSIIRVKDEAIKKAVGEITGQPYSAAAPEWFLIVLDLYRNRAIVEEEGKTFTGAGDFYTFIQAFMDGAIAAQNMAVAAESLGLGICYFGSVFQDMKHLAALTKLPPLTFPLTGLGMGYPAVSPMEKPRLPAKVQVFTDHYKEEKSYLAALKDYDREMAKYVDTRHPDTTVPPFTVSVTHRNTGSTETGEKTFRLLKDQGFTWADK